jgi:hypothetical protein
MNTADIEIQNLYEGLKAAAYYIERLELAQQRRKVRDMTEAMEHYHRVAIPLLAAYDSMAGTLIDPVNSTTPLDRLNQINANQATS